MGFMVLFGSTRLINANYMDKRERERERERERAKHASQRRFFLYMCTVVVSMYVKLF